ncbi:MAG: glycosyltransferase family 4 protein [Vicinamibacterales bacterium]
MRIALVATGGFDRSGRERIIPSLVWLVSRLALRHEVFVYVLRYHETPCTYELAGATIRDLGRPEGLRAQRRALERALLDDGPFDVVHAYWAQPAGRLVAPLAARHGLPSIVTLDSGEFAALPAIGYGLQATLRGRWAVRTAVRHATRLTVCSEYQAGLARRHGLAPDVIPLGVDLTTFPRRAHVPPGPPFRLVNVASLNAVKDHATLLRAVALLRTGGLDVELDLVGEDTMGGRLQALAAQLGLTGRVVFHGFLPSDALVPILHAAHLFVLASRHEAAGVVLLEAAACGVPVAGTRVGFLADWSPAMADTVSPADPQALAGSVARLLGDPDRREAMAARATAWARHHDADWTADAFERLYLEVRGHPARMGRRRLFRRTGPGT